MKLAILALTLIGLYLIACYILPNLYGRRLGSKLRQSLAEYCKEDQLILSFDDGPSAISPKLLDCLEHSSKRALFFMLASKLEKMDKQAARSYLEALENAGHILGIHAYEHRLALKPWSSYQDLKRAYKVFRELGFKPRYLRPPHGFYNIGIILFAWRYGLRLVHWDSLLGDWKLEQSSQILGKTQAAYHRAKSLGNLPVLIVMHDGCAGAADPEAYRMCPTNTNLVLQWLQGSSR